jgi:hypothetical protein
MYACVCLCVGMYVCMYSQIAAGGMHSLVHTGDGKLCMYVYACVCVCVCGYVCMCVCMCMIVYVCVWVCMYVCIQNSLSCAADRKL